MRNRTGWVLAALPLFTAVVFWTSCNGFFVSGSSLDHITLSPKAVYLKVGETDNFTASGVTVDGTTSDITSSATWTTGSSTIATVNAGVVTAVAAGSTTISAAQSGVTGTANITVGTQALNTTLNVTPSNPTVIAGQTVQLTATATFADGSTRDFTSLVTWSSSNTANVTVSSAGLVSGVTSGQSATITATIATATSSATGSVTVTVQ
jgi:uncharacterized protein YjdB